MGRRRLWRRGGSEHVGGRRTKRVGGTSRRREGVGTRRTKVTPSALGGGGRPKQIVRHVLYLLPFAPLPHPEEISLRISAEQGSCGSRGVIACGSGGGGVGVAGYGRPAPKQAAGVHFGGPLGDGDGAKENKRTRTIMVV